MDNKITCAPGRGQLMTRDPNNHEIACEILAEHVIVTESLHPDAKTEIADVIRHAVETWLEGNADEYRNRMGEP